MFYKVKEVSEMTGVSIRTLHHYDEIGLLKPHSISNAGHRSYSEENLERLQQILFFKELDFSLIEIKDILDDPSFNRKAALEAQKSLIIKKINRFEEIIKSIDQTMESIEGGREMKKNDMFDAFDMSEIEKDKKEYVDEVRQKYSKETVEESERRTSAYTKEDWAQIQAKSNAIYQTIAANMEKGPSDSKVQEALDEYRQYITDHFYECTLEIFRGLGDLYVNDSRFTANIDKYKPGLPQFLREAMHVYCDNEEKNNETNQ